MNQYETERERLARQYAEFSDVALAELAADAGSLTDSARDALRSELTKRSLPVDLAKPDNAQPIQQRQISGPLVMVKRFRDLPEAQIAESILDSAGIDCFLADENTIRMDWLWSNLLGGFKLMVRPEDLDTATQLLDQANVSESTEQGDTTKESGEVHE
ncbi:MAG TPA: DUF2007 domain-containing protein [Candidatus Angelobacter sp.]|nr:DUF2007 domain-containing protein [Candidatus Angelobacter sp.]